MILFVDGFDWGDAAHCGGQISGGLINPAKYTMFSSGTNIAMVNGRLSAANSGSGQALRFNGSGFSGQTITRNPGVALFSPCLGFAFRPNGGGYTVCRFETVDSTRNSSGSGGQTNDGTALALMYLGDGTITVNTGPIGMPGGIPSQPGTVLWTSTFTLTLNKWIFIELLCNPTNGTWSLYIDDVLIVSQIGVAFGLSTPIIQFSLCAESFSVHDLDDLYLTDGNRLGPCQITGFPPNLQSTHQWNPLAGTNLSNVQEFGNRIFTLGLPTPDDDSSFVYASATATDTYGFAKPACYGRILALVLNADAFALTGGPSVNFQVRVAGVAYPGAFSAAFGIIYGIQQSIFETNPANGLFWTDTDIASVLAGFTFAGSGTLRVTQFMAEKLVSLRGYPFECGGGSYSFTN